MKLIVESDGGARGNPGPAAFGFVVKSSEGETLFEKGAYLGKTTNNVAEYRAVVAALTWLTAEKEKLQCTEVDYFLDSELVVKQLNGEYKIRDLKLKSLATEVMGIVRSLKIPVKFEHVRREKNRAADKILNRVLDERNST